MNGAIHKAILQDHVLPYWKENCGHKHFIQHNGETKHICDLVKEFLSLQILPLVKWSPQLHDLNPIEKFCKEPKTKWNK